MSESNIPSELRYTRSHEWVRSLANGQVEVGITDHAQEALGDLRVEVDPAAAAPVLFTATEYAQFLAAAG